MYTVGLILLWLRGNGRSCLCSGLQGNRLPHEDHFYIFTAFKCLTDARRLTDRSACSWGVFSSYHVVLKEHFWALQLQSCSFVVFFFLMTTEPPVTIHLHFRTISEVSGW